MSKQEVRHLIYQKYGALLLSRKQAATEVRKSLATLDRWRKKGLYLEYKKIGKARNSTIEYPIDTIVDYIVNNNKKTI